MTKIYATFTGNPTRRGCMISQRDYAALLAANDTGKVVRLENPRAAIGSTTLRIAVSPFNAHLKVMHQKWDARSAARHNRTIQV